MGQPTGSQEPDGLGLIITCLGRLSGKASAEYFALDAIVPTTTTNGESDDGAEVTLFIIEGVWGQHRRASRLASAQSGISALTTSTFPMSSRSSPSSTLTVMSTRQCWLQYAANIVILRPSLPGRHSLRAVGRKKPWT